jgi:hypothetical protein
MDEEMNKLYNIVYETTCSINGQIYVGVHSTNDIDDGYLGSGARFEMAVKKYGKEAFSRKILYNYDTIEAAYLKEEEIVKAPSFSRVMKSLF